jgi:hypothetical protein
MRSGTIRKLEGQFLEVCLLAGTTLCDLRVAAVAHMLALYVLQNTSSPVDSLVRKQWLQHVLIGRRYGSTRQVDYV